MTPPLIPHQTGVSENLIRQEGGEANGPPEEINYIGYIFALKKHIKGQEPAPIGSNTSFGPPMDPTGFLKRTSKFLSLFKAVFTISKSNTIQPH